MGSTVVVCNILQEHKNKYMFVFCLFQIYRIGLIHTLIVRVP